MDVKRYGLVSTLFSLSRYVPKLNEEEKLKEQLKKFADGETRIKKMEAHPLDADSVVDRRCESLLKKGFVSVLYSMGKVKTAMTETMQETIAQVLLAFSTCPRNRGKLVQDGGVKVSNHHIVDKLFPLFDV